MHGDLLAHFGQLGRVTGRFERHQHADLAQTGKPSRYAYSWRPRPGTPSRSWPGGNSYFRRRWRSGRSIPRRWSCRRAAWPPSRRRHCRQRPEPIHQPDLTKPWNCSLRATKSVSALISTRAPVAPFDVTTTRPSAAMRPAFLAAAARPFLRSQSTAASISAPFSARACLTVHHASASLLAQFLDEGGGNLGHGYPLPFNVVG